jgi:glucokinase
VKTNNQTLLRIYGMLAAGAGMINAPVKAAGCQKLKIALLGGGRSMILAGDIGGTKTLLGVFEQEQGVKHPLRQKSYPSQHYNSLEDILADFLAGGREALEAASFAVAGPVRRGKAQITNLPWVIAEESIRQAFHFPSVHLINDLESAASAVPFLEAEDLTALRVGTPDPTGTIAVIAPGTGLGEAFLTWNGQRYQAHPGEGGHSSFAPGSAVEVELLAYLYPRFGHLSFERVGSGSGIPNLYDFLRDSGRFPEPDWLKEALAVAPDPTPVIANAALNKEAAICEAVLDLFVRILGGEVGNLALTVLATGGIYLGGGIPPRILSRLREPDFLEAMGNKGRFKRLLDQIPVYVILDSEVTLHGAAYDALAAHEARSSA